MIDEEEDEVLIEMEDEEPTPLPPVQLPATVCPECHRKQFKTYRVGSAHVYECRSGHRWSVEDPNAVQLLARAQEKMRKARAAAPPPVWTADDTNDFLED